MKKHILTIFIIMFFTLSLASAHMIWNKTTGPASHADVEAGELVLDEKLIKANDFIDLDGEWAFYPDELLTPDEVRGKDAKDFIPVPSSWKDYQTDQSSARGVGTYALSIPASELEGDLLSLRINKINLAYQIYVNDALLHTLGKVGEDAKKTTGERMPEVVTFKLDQEKIDIVIQVSNFTYKNVGGIVNSILFGSHDAINTYSFYNTLLQMITILFFFLYAIYAFFAFVTGVSRKQSLIFALLLIVLILTVLVDDDLLILSIIDLSHQQLMWLNNLAYSAAYYFIILLTLEALKVRGVKVRRTHYILQFAGLIIIIQLFLPSYLVRDYVYLYYLPIALTIIMTSYHLSRQVIRANRVSLILLTITLLSLLMGAVFGALKNQFALNVLYYPFEYIIAVSAYGAYLAHKILKMYKRNSEMESALLQAQMQPHFIFNTLNSIISLSYIDQERMVKLLRNFSTYLRFNFKEIRLDKLIPLTEELEIVKAYIEIQQERFTDRIILEWKIDDDLAHVKIPSLTIQPLVENVINHAILADYEPGLLSVKVKQREKVVYVEVSDDGPGIEAEKLAHILKTTNDKKAGVGLKNTHERLKRVYKNEGLTLISNEQGLTVSFNIPK